MESNRKLWIFVVLGFIVSIYTVAGQSPEPYEQLSQHWFNKCFNETKSTAAFDKLYTDAGEFKNYLRYSFKLIPDNKQAFCQDVRDALNDKMKILAKDMKPCLSAKEKFLEEFVRKSFSEFLHFLCHNNQEYMNAFFSPNAQDCRARLLHNENPNLNNCFSKLLKPSSGEPTKTELCTDLTTVKKCFAEMLEVQCPTYAPYKKLNEEFFKYVSKPCSGCAFYLNSLLLTVSLLISYLFSR